MSFGLVNQGFSVGRDYVSQLEHVCCVISQSRIASQEAKIAEFLIFPHMIIRPGLHTLIFMTLTVNRLNSGVFNVCDRRSSSIFSPLLISYFSF